MWVPFLVAGLGAVKDAIVDRASRTREAQRVPAFVPAIESA